MNSQPRIAGSIIRVVDTLGHSEILLPGPAASDQSCVLRIFNRPTSSAGTQPFSLCGVTVLEYQYVDVEWNRVDKPPWEGVSYGWRVVSGPRDMTVDDFDAVPEPGAVAAFLAWQAAKDGA